MSNFRLLFFNLQPRLTRGERSEIKNLKLHTVSEVGRHFILRVARDWIVFGEARATERVKVNAVRATIEDHFGHAQPNGRRLLEAGAAEPADEIQAVYVRRAVEDGARVGAHVVQSRMS